MYDKYRNHDHNNKVGKDKFFKVIAREFVITN
jgi:hypothetical protein